VHHDHGVEVRPLRGAADGCGLPDRRDPEYLSEIGELADDSDQVRLPVAEVRAEPDGDPRIRLRWRGG
jgi:hypothetical protein